MSIKFDRFRLAIPSSAVEILNPDAFSHSVSKDGVATHHRFEQKAPFYYQILIDCLKNTTYLEFSGKSLMENYTSLIQASNIIECFRNINSYQICSINIPDALSSAMVCQCDVTADIPYHGPFSELSSKLILRNNRHYTITTSGSNRFTLQNTVTTHRKRERLIVYDKSEEMRRKINEPFLSSISNPPEQIKYFDHKARLELNLNSVDRIRKYLGVTDTSLVNVLYSQSDPIGSFLQCALSEDNLIESLKNHTPKLRSLEHLLLLCLCDFNMQTLEAIVRDTTGKRNSITQTMQPFKTLYQTIQRKSQNIEAGIDLDTLRELIKRVVSNFILNPETSDNSLLSLYLQSETVSRHTPSDYDIFNIPFVVFPFLPDVG